MPKIVTKEEKARLKEAMYVETIKLIKKKGLKRITVEDVIHAVGIAKGTFYNHYTSKEELLYDVIRKSEEQLFRQILAIDFQTGDFQIKLRKALNEIYLADSSIVLYLNPEDLNSLIQKLPDQTKKQQNEKQSTNFQRIVELLGIDQTDQQTFGVISYLMDCLHFTAANVDYGVAARQETLEIIIDALAAFLAKKKEDEGVQNENTND
ncbi:TetR/AcrR family transcriptional regulator [Candidatus Enterococcus murrayae]|uniref:TetR/AcrR family transcriptional regulator n=1 Tax=Candidatus Enterococcus murrayae TaxID=2815321 RepID=A0ABS3HFN1_9ENTE|nr:TetR/AcrR family transcriptional regulator [Enterococcus sp. MJM16]MBO0452256.1 TetR/AcrR family transcriptional regulator [Enterococcus sp. MJM16]